MSTSAMAPQNLASNLIQLRKARGFTQHYLAKIASIPRSTLNHFESGSGNPSLQNLIKLSNALAVSIEELFAEPRLDIQLLPAKNTPSRTRDKGRVIIYSLLPYPIPQLGLEKLEMAPNSRFTGSPHLKGTREFFTVLHGKARLRVAGESHLVESGATLVFPGDERHSYENPFSAKLLAVSVVILASRV